MASGCWMGGAVPVPVRCSVRLQQEVRMLERTCMTCLDSGASSIVEQTWVHEGRPCLHQTSMAASGRLPQCRKRRTRFQAETCAARNNSGCRRPPPPCREAWTPSVVACQRMLSSYMGIRNVVGIVRHSAQAAVGLSDMNQHAESPARQSRATSAFAEPF